MSARILLLVFVIEFTSASIYGQEDHNSFLPNQKDWFLSTGDWDNDPQLYVTEIGSGVNPIIVLHGGWGAEHSGMKDAVAGLTDQYRFIFYDQRGSLRSPFPDSLISFSQHIEDLERLRKELKLDKLRIVAHSMGSVLASAFAAQYPNRVEELVLIAPAHLKNPIPPEDEYIMKNANAALQSFLNRPEVEQEFRKYKFNKDNSSLSSQEKTAIFRINFARRMLYNIENWSQLGGGRAIYQGHVFGLTAATYPSEGWNYFHQFKNVDYPINIVVGDHDFLDMGNNLISKWSKDIQQIELTIIKNAGHIIWIDAPQEFKSSLEAILDH